MLKMVTFLGEHVEMSNINEYAKWEKKKEKKQSKYTTAWNLTGKNALWKFYKSKR